MISIGGLMIIVLIVGWRIYWKGVFRFVCVRVSVCIKVKNVGYMFYKKRNYWLLFISYLFIFINFLILLLFWNILRKYICKMFEYFLCKINVILNDDEVYDIRFVNWNIVWCFDWRFVKYRK